MINELLSIIIGTFVGYQIREIREALSSIKDSLLEGKKASPSVISGNPALTRPLSGNSGVVAPKSPQLLDWEEEQEIRKMNPGS